MSNLVFTPVMAGAPVEDRRAAERFPCGPETVGRLIAARTGELWQATIRDISSSGIALVLPRRFEPGTLLAFELINSHQSFTRTIFAKVMRVSMQTCGNWMLGCAFAGSLSEEEVQSLRRCDHLRPVPPPAPPPVPKKDHKAIVRCTRNDKSLCPAPAGQSDEWPATIYDVSQDRISLLVPRPFKRGAILKLELDGADGRPQTLLARVIQAQPAVGGEWSLTCSLARRRTDEEQQAALSR